MAFDVTIGKVNVYLGPPPPECGVRVIWVLGPAQEQQAPVAKTPQYLARGCHSHLETDLMDTMTTTQFKNYRVKPVDRLGHPTAVENPQWLTDNSDVLALEPAADGLSCKVSAVGIPTGGTPVKVMWSADGKQGDEVLLLTATAEIEVTPADAVSVEMTSDPAEEQTGP